MALKGALLFRYSISVQHDCKLTCNYVNECFTGICEDVHVYLILQIIHACPQKRCVSTHALEHIDIICQLMQVSLLILNLPSVSLHLFGFSSKSLGQDSQSIHLFFQNNLVQIHHRENKVELIGLFDKLVEDSPILKFIHLKTRVGKSILQVPDTGTPQY